MLSSVFIVNIDMGPGLKICGNRLELDGLKLNHLG